MDNQSHFVLRNILFSTGYHQLRKNKSVSQLNHKCFFYSLGGKKPSAAKLTVVIEIRNVKCTIFYLRLKMHKQRIQLSRFFNEIESTLLECENLSDTFLKD